MQDKLRNKSFNIQTDIFPKLNVSFFSLGKFIIWNKRAYLVLNRIHNDMLRPELRK